MKYLGRILLSLIAVLAVAIPFTASALITLPPSLQRGDLLVASNTTQIVRLATGTTAYVLQMVNGVPTWVQTSSLGITGGSSSTLIFAGNAIIVTASGTDGYIITNNGVTSTLGNWAGTWQGVNSSTFYLASNPAGYITTSTANSGTISPLTRATTTLWWDFSVPNVWTGAQDFSDVKMSSLVANRLLYIDGSNDIADVSDLTAWIAGSGCVSVANDGDGTVTISCVGGGVTTTINGLQVPVFQLSATGTGFQVTTFSTSTIYFGAAPLYFIPLQASGTQWNAAHASSSFIGPLLASSSFIGPLVASSSLAHAIATLSGEPYLTLSGQAFTAGKVSLTSSVVGVLPLANGGTGTSTTPVKASFLVGDGTLYQFTTLPDCASGNYMTYNTTTRAWACAADVSGGGGGSVSTSSPITINQFPFWTSVSGGLSGSSTLSISGTTLNNSGTISVNGSAVLTSAPATTTIIAQGTATGPALTFATSGPLISGITGGVSTITFTTISTSSILAGYSTSTGGNPTASAGLSAVNGTANTFMRSDGAPAIDQTITPNWTGLHQFTTNGVSSTQVRTVSATVRDTLTVDAGTLYVDGTNDKVSVRTTGASSTVHITGSNAVTSTLRVSDQAGNLVMDVNTTSTGQNNIFAVQSSSGVPYFQVATSGLIYLTGSSTAVTIGGAALSAGACTSTVVTFAMSLSTSTDNVWMSPQIYPGDGFSREPYISTTGATSNVTAQICAVVAATPTASKWNVSVIRNLNN